MTRGTKIVLGTLGAIGVVGIYLHFRKGTGAVASTLPTPASPITKVTNLISSGFEKLLSGGPSTRQIGTSPLPADLDAKARALGTALHTQWMLAWSLAKPYFSNGVKCYETATTKEVAVRLCPAERFLEGW